MIAKAGDRIDAAVEILRGLRVFDQPRAEIDEGIQVVDLAPAGTGVQPGELGAVKVQGGQVQSTVVEGLEALETPASLASLGSSAAARRLSQSAACQPIPSRAGSGRVFLLADFCVA